MGTSRLNSSVNFLLSVFSNDPAPEASFRRASFVIDAENFYFYRENLLCSGLCSRTIGKRDDGHWASKKIVDRCVATHGTL